MLNFRRLFNLLGKWKYHYALAGILLVISSIVRMMEPKILQIALDGVLVFSSSNGEVKPSESDSVANFFYSILPAVEIGNLYYLLLGIVGLMICISILRSGSRLLASAVNASTTEKAAEKLRNKLFTHIQALPLAHFSKIPTGEMIQRCTGDIDTIRNFLSNQIAEVIRLVAVFAGALFMMLAVHPLYALISITVVPFVFLTAFYFFKKEGTVWDEHEREQDKLTDIIQENLSGIRVVQAFANGAHEIERFKKQNEAKRKVGLKHVTLHMWFWAFSDSLVMLQVAISLVAGGFFTLYGQISIGEFGSFIIYSTMVAWPMRQLGRIVSQMGMASVAIQRIYEILDAKEEDYDGAYLNNKQLNGKLEFKNVSFHYGNEDELVLDNVNLVIEAGEKIALLGPTGAGKSTLIALLMRFYEPTAGEILLDGKPLPEIDKTFLRTQIGIVHQKPFLFSSNIRNNIAYTEPAIDDEQIEGVAKVASVNQFIEKLQNGYQTVVGEKGVNLSGGQKQRIALARTLLSDPAILILDDATSAVDTETEYDIQEALQEKLNGKTTILIAHRLTSVQHADRIVVLDKGAVMEVGDHETLLKQKGFYRQIYDIQIALEKEISEEISN